MVEKIKKEITKTYLRTEETMQKYINHIEGLRDGTAKDLISDPESRAIHVFNHWLIIESDFPYDNIEDKTHILFSRREVFFDWDLLSLEEKEELFSLKKGFLKDHYDVVYENLPSGQTVPGHFHLILLVLKRD